MIWRLEEESVTWKCEAEAEAEAVAANSLLWRIHSRDSK